MNQYLKQIDALRFYAVFGVMLGHLYPKELPSIRFAAEFYSYLPGVPLFFCISGFLITGILISNQNQPIKKLLKNFYIRRFLRIFPVYYLTIFALFIVNIDDYRSWFLYDFFYVTNIVQGLNGNFDGSVAPHFWSLAVEEQFYLVWPILFLIFRGKNCQIILLWSIFLTGSALMLFSENKFLMARTLGCLSYLGSGSLLAYFWHYRKKYLFQLNALLTATLILFLAFVVVQSFGFLKISNQFHLLLSMLLIPLITLKFAIGFRTKMIKAIVEFPAIIYMGKISYGIYIFHLLALFPAVAIKKIGSFEFLENIWIMLFFKIGITILLATLSWEFFEKRINKLKNKFEYN
jgi:peptidoglycan/LPS O-acetylase OafA/YrhL